MNIQQGQSLLAVADGGLAQINNVLRRMLALASESASGQVTDTQRGQDIDTEYQGLAKEINAIASSSQYAGQSLLNYQNSQGAFSWNSSSVLAGFYEAQVLRNTHFGANVTRVSGDTGTFSDTGQIARFGQGQYGLPTGTSGTFNAGPLEGIGKEPVGPTRFLTGIGAAGAIGLTISAFNTVTLGLEHDEVSYQDSGTSTVTVAGPNGTSIVESVDTYLSTHPNELFAGIVTTTVTTTTSNVATQSAAMTAITTLTSALRKVTAERATLGAYESRFTFSGSATESDLEHTQAAMSVLGDADVAGVKASLSAQDVQTQAAIAAIAQAAQLPSELLKLLQS